MPERDKAEVQEAELAAQVSAEHAEKAQQQADKDDLAAKRADAGGPVCPNCRGELIKHDDANPFKAGASHCNTCGACWAPGLREIRDNHPAPVGWGKGKPSKSDGKE